MDIRRGALRALAGSLAAATLLSLAPLTGTAGAADPLPPLADPLGDGAFCDGAPTAHPFSDLAAESAATRQVIVCLVATELTAGTSATTFGPGGTVTRRQMALFIKRTADLFDEFETDTPGLNALPAYDGQPDYSDVDGEAPAFREAIGQLTQAEIVGGLGDGTFRPGAPVTRRQMAAFVNRLQAFLTGAPYTTSGDFFDDDDDDPGEANLNALAAVGVFQGDGRGSVDPGGLLTRRQMANILLRNAQVQVTAERIDRPFADEPPPAGPIALTPDATAAIEYVAGINATTPEDDRTYSASSLPASSGGFRITLVDADNVRQVDGQPRFTEDGTTGLAQAGTVAARIVSVNGATVSPVQSIGGVQPASGTITFVIDGDSVESVVPVLYVDGGANTRLEIDDAGAATEPHDVGGATQYIPAQAADNLPVSGTVLLDGTTFAVVDNAGGPVTVRFASGDTYRIGSAPPFNTATAAVFQAALSAGDALRTCQTNLGAPNFYSQDGPNEYCLDDVAPADPVLTANAGTPADTVVELDWAAIDGADSFNVYRNAESCANTTAAELVLLANVPATQTAYSATGLAPATPYCFVVTTLDGSDESTRTPGTGADGDDHSAFANTAGVIEPPRITVAALTTDAVQTGAATTGDVITLTFSEPMDPATVDDATFSVTDADGDTTSILCFVSAPPTPDPAPAAGNGVTLAACSLGDGTGNSVLNDTLTITLEENGDDANVQGGQDAIEYPLTITATTVLKDADDAQGVDVAGSPDKTIS